MCGRGEGSRDWGRVKFQRFLFPRGGGGGVLSLKRSTVLAFAVPSWALSPKNMARYNMYNVLCKTS